MRGMEAAGPGEKRIEGSLSLLQAGDDFGLLGIAGGAGRPQSVPGMPVKGGLAGADDLRKGLEPLEFADERLEAGRVKSVLFEVEQGRERPSIAELTGIDGQPAPGR